MFLANNAALFRPQVENSNAYILANWRMKSSCEVGSGCAGRANGSSPVLSGLKTFQE